jgi:hypothetical protein
MFRSVHKHLRKEIWRSKGYHEDGGDHLFGRRGLRTEPVIGYKAEATIAILLFGSFFVDVFFADGENKYGCTRK